MTISELREMNRRDFTIWFKKAKSSDLKDVLRAENLAGGISKFKIDDLLQVVLDLVDGIVTELTQQLKPNPKPRAKKDSTGKPNKPRAKKQKNIVIVEYDDTCWFEEEEFTTVNFDELLNYNMNTVTADVTADIVEEKPQEEIWYEEMIKTPKDVMGMFGGSLFEQPSHWYYFVSHIKETPTNTKEEHNQVSKEMKSKYRKMVKYFHPDNLKTGNREKFEEIQLAWESANKANKIFEEEYY